MKIVTSYIHLLYKIFALDSVIQVKKLEHQFCALLRSKNSVSE
jgi:hypothetical protein